LLLRDITIPKGTEVTAFVQGDMKLDMAKFGAPAPIGPAAASANAMASITVESSVLGADIEVDGNFVGSTPSKVDVTPGSHAISVKKKEYQDWTRTMNVSGTGAKINAGLEQLATGKN
jgi:PEGA domain